MRPQHPAKWPTALDIPSDICFGRPHLLADDEKTAPRCFCFSWLYIQARMGWTVKTGNRGAKETTFFVTIGTAQSRPAHAAPWGVRWPPYGSSLRTAAFDECCLLLVQPIGGARGDDKEGAMQPTV